MLGTTVLECLWSPLKDAPYRRPIDSLRHGRMVAQKHEEIAREIEWQQQPLSEAMDQALDQVIDDDVLRLIFTAFLTQRLLPIISFPAFEETCL
jgi:predicted RNA polymerase sigma factor